MVLSYILVGCPWFHISFHHWFIPHRNIGTHKWPAPNVTGFIAQLVRASHRYREVTGSNPVEVLKIFEASLRNCKNCVHDCEDHSLTWKQLLFIKERQLLWYCNEKVAANTETKILGKFFPNNSILNSHRSNDICKIITSYLRTKWRL